MTEQQIRQQVADTFAAYLGAKKGSAKHKELIDIYNSYLPHPAGYVMKYNDPWCAASASAIAIKLGYTDIVPPECSCSRQIALWQKMNRWIEDESIVPKVGMYCYYDWGDSATNYASTDDKNGPNHVGIVVSVNGNTFRVIEGNKGDESVVGYRDVKVNGRYLRGFGDPDYASKASNNPPLTLTNIKVPILKKGIVHQSVKVLQTLLNMYGANLDVDGSFGPATDTALRNYQKSHSLTVDGSCGAQTWTSFYGV